MVDGGAGWRRRSPQQKHHLLPLSLTRRGQIATMLQELNVDGFSLHEDANLLSLPADERLAWLLGAALHRGPHPAYTDVVAARLDRIRQAAGDGPVARAGRLRRIRRLQRTLSRILTGRAPGLLYLNRRDPLHFFSDYSAIDGAIAGIDWTVAVVDPVQAALVSSDIAIPVHSAPGSLGIDADRRFTG